jgi:hypothetical protein
VFEFLWEMQDSPLLEDAETSVRSRLKSKQLTVSHFGTVRNGNETAARDRCLQTLPLLNMA